MVAHQQETYVCSSKHLVGESQWHAQETDEHRYKPTLTVYTGMDTAIIFLEGLDCLLDTAGSDIMKLNVS